MAQPINMSNSGPGVPQPWPDKFSDETAAVEFNKITAAGIGLVAVALVHLFVGVVTIPGVEPGKTWTVLAGISSSDLMLVAYALISEATLLFFLAGIMVLRRSLIAALLCLLLVVASSILLVIAQSWITSALTAGVIIALLIAIGAIRNLHKRVDAEGERNPIVSQYRHLIRMLVRMMAADKHIDKRERHAISVQCDSLRISRKIQKRFLDEALEELESGQAAKLENIARKYLELSDTNGLPHPARTALLAAAAVASADGIFGPEEEQELFALGRALNTSQDVVSTILAQHKTTLSELTPNLACQLLNVELDATLLELDEAYQTLRDELDPEDYGHLGHNLGAYAKERMQVIDRAYEMLKEVIH